MPFRKYDKRRLAQKIAQEKRREREKISKLQNLEERESELGGENQTEGTATEREISRKRSLDTHTLSTNHTLYLRSSLLFNLKASF